MFNIDAKSLSDEAFKLARKNLPVTNGLAYFATLLLLNKICLILTSVYIIMKLLNQSEKIAGDKRVSLFCCFIVVE